MNINKKLDRVKQWAGEKMGAESKTNVSDEFKSLEMEMDLRQEGKLAEITCYDYGLTFSRHGQITQVDDNIRQISFEEKRSG